MTTLHTDADRQQRVRVFTKGAPDVLLARCSQELVGEETRPSTAARRAEILQANEVLAGEALRTLGLLRSTLPADSLEQNEVDEGLEQELVFLGSIGMIDPPREEAKRAVVRAQKCRHSPAHDYRRSSPNGSGDCCGTRYRKGRPRFTGAELEKLSDEELARTVQDVSVYARVNPEHKLRIVKALQAAVLRWR